MAVKIITTVLVVAAVALAVGLTALVQIDHVAANGRAMYTQNLVRITDLEKVEYGLEEAKAATATPPPRAPR